jgi:predicted nucleotidyltransferase
MQDKITEYLQKQPDIVFHYIFGSFLKSDRYRDIDIGVYFRDDQYELLRLGEIISDLEEITDTKVDVIPLNRLYDKNPAFAHEIISTGELSIHVNGEVSAEDKETWVNFKVSCIKHFKTMGTQIRII